jgi:signal transduction histidine kinase
VIAIEDEGPGVSDTDTSRIWDPFYRVADQVGATGGTGIGLAIVKRLTEMHGGRVRAERGTRGARFIVELPGARREHDADAVRMASAGA